MVKLLIDSGANPSQKIGFEDFLLLKRLKPSKMARKVFDRSAGISESGSSQSPTGASRDTPIQNMEGFRQFGQRGPIHFPPEYVEGKELCLFEIAAMSGHLGIASYILEQ